MRPFHRWRRVACAPTRPAGRYTRAFGDDYFAFRVHRTLFLVLNAQLWKDATDAPELLRGLPASHTPLHPILYTYMYVYVYIYILWHPGERLSTCVVRKGDREARVMRCSAR